MLSGQWKSTHCEIFWQFERGATSDSFAHVDWPHSADTIQYKTGT